MNQDKNTLFDTEFGLNQLSGNRELLIKMLDRFSSDYASVSQELNDAVAQQDMATGKAKAHTIKGVAGNLGLWKLHHCSKDLEEVFKSGDGDFNTCLTEFATVLSDTFAALERFKRGEAVEPVEATEEDTATAEAPSQDAKAELLTLLENFEFIDADKLQQLLADSGIESSKHADIAQAISDLDYPAAIELLNS